MKDNRAPWCGLNHFHGAHGPEAKGGPCGGFDPSPETSGGRMSHGVTKVLVESAVRSLNDKAERLGMLRRYEIDFGSPAKGQQHKIVEKVSGQVLGSTPIGNTLSKAHQYLLAMNQALAGAGTDHTAIHDDVARRGVTVYNGKPLGDPALVRMANRPNNFADPDARSARRPESER